MIRKLSLSIFLFFSLISCSKTTLFGANPQVLETSITDSSYQPAEIQETTWGQVIHQEYYIDPVNGDDEKNGTSPENAWRTFRNIYSYRSDYTPDYAILLSPGDTIYLMDGVHRTIFRPGDDSGAANGRPAVMRFRDVHGTAEAPIRLIAYPGHNPVMDPDYQGECLYILNSSYIEIGGIEFRNSFSSGEGGNIAIVTSAHIKIHEVEVHGADGADDDNISGLNATDIWDIEIYNCSFHDNYDRLAADTDGVSTHNSTNMVFFLGGNISVHDCLISQRPTGSDMTQVNSGMGIKYKHASSDPTAFFHVYRNVFINNKFWAFLSGTANTWFHHNIIIGGSGYGVGSEDCAGPTHQSNQLYEYNTFYLVYSVDRQFSSGGFYFYPTTEWRNDEFSDDPSNITFRHNIIYDDKPYWNEAAAINIYPYISNKLYTKTAPEMHIFHNCYFNSNYDVLFSFAAGMNQGELGGLYSFKEWQTLGYDLDSVIADPMFLSIDPDIARYNPTADSFRPATSGSCKAMGAYAGYPMP